MAAVSTFEIPDGTLEFAPGPLVLEVRFFSIEGNGCGEAGDQEDDQGIVDTSESN